MTAQQDRLETVVNTVRAAVDAQRQDPDPAHEDFYAWGGALTEMTRRLAHACTVLRGQIARYGDNRILRDDQGLDPAIRLEAMRFELDRLAVLLEQAGAAADGYHQEASHLAVEVDPDAEAAR